MYLQLLSDKSKRKIHVKADGTCNGSIEEDFSGTGFGVFVKELRGTLFTSSYLACLAGGRARPRS